MDPHKDPSRVPSGKKRGNVLFTNALACGFFFPCHFIFLKLATALSESEEDGVERSESSYDACLSRLQKKPQASRIQVTMLGTNDGEENLNFPRITSSQLRQI